jgi:hypothetical protein
MTFISSIMPQRPAKYGAVPPACEKIYFTLGVRANRLL